MDELTGFINTLFEVTKSTPNDIELGGKIRSFLERLKYTGFNVDSVKEMLLNTSMNYDKDNKSV